jgi:DNA-binding helix-hairpin-helix protein with protein kinase domain
MQVPGIGGVLISNLLSWRAQCIRQFRYNPNAPLPPTEVRAVKLKHAQTRQAALTELRGGAANLDALENKTRAAARQAKNDILDLTRAHAQAVADLSVCS